MKQFLENNKIYFETVVAILLAIMSIFVSLGTVIITHRQTEFIGKQTEILRRTSLPLIEIKFFQEMNPETKYYAYNKLKIINNGSPVFNFEAKTLSFLRVHYESLNSNGQWITQEKLIPIINYFTAQFPTDQSTGEITNFIGIQDELGNNGRVRKIASDFLKVKDNDEKVRTSLIEDEHYLKITYSDIFDEKYEKYYKLGINKKHLPLEEGNKLEKIYNNRIKDNYIVLDGSNLTKSSEIIKILESKTESEENNEN